jgi:hypothetical protein
MLRIIEGDHDAFTGDALRRGWCMKQGRMKRLMRPKRGKAALRAKMSGQGPEVSVGRNVFKRSTQRQPRWHEDYEYGMGKRTRERDEMIQEALDCHDEPWSEEEWLVAREEDTESFSRTDHLCSMSDISPDLASLETMSCYDGDSTSSCGSWIEMSPVAHQDKEDTWVNLLSAKSPCKKAATPWELAIIRAAEVAAIYFTKPFAEASPPMIPRRQRGRASVKYGVSEECVSRLLQEADARFIAPRCFGSSESFEKLRSSFFEEHGIECCRRLQQNCFREPINVQATPLCAQVTKRFQKACDTLPGTLKPAFHGTDDKNLSSIYKLGLVIPGSGNGVKVVNGSAHGRGIYTATMDNSMLSWGFCRGASRPMFICAVLDDATALASEYTMGIRTITAESAHVRHVGNAMVVFDEARVAPLYVVTRRYIPPTPRISHASIGPSPPSQVFKTRRPLLQAKPRDSAHPVLNFLSRRCAQKRR